MSMTEFEQQTVTNLIQINNKLGVLEEIVKQVGRHELSLNDGKNGVVVKTEANTQKITTLFNKVNGHLKNHWSWIVLLAMSSGTIVTLIIFILKR